MRPNYCRVGRLAQKCQGAIDTPKICKLHLNRIQSLVAARVSHHTHTHTLTHKQTLFSQSRIKNKSLASLTHRIKSVNTKYLRGTAGSNAIFNLLLLLLIRTVFLFNSMEYMIRLHIHQNTIWLLTNCGCYIYFHCR